jgi:3-keto-5-aminohexanoate cleavage enzyme
VDPLIITVAPVGAEVMPEQTPYLPVTPAQLGDTARAIRAAGASIVHVHCRNDDGTNTHDVERFRQARDAVRAASDLIVQFSTGGAIGMTPRGARGAAGAAAGDGDAHLRHGELRRRRVREQLPDHARHRGEDAASTASSPELEIFDLGHLSNAKRLAAEGADPAARRTSTSCSACPAGSTLRSRT